MWEFYFLIIFSEYYSNPIHILTDGEVAAEGNEEAVSQSENGHVTLSDFELIRVIGRGSYAKVTPT